MSFLKDKKILLAVTGGIAAYKSTYLVRCLKKKGATVKVIMTPSAKEFVTPLSLSTLSENKVEYTFFDNEEWNNHVELGLWADIMIVAPATARTISKMVNGNCDNLVVASYLSAKCPVYIAPAMDLDMYRHESTKENLSKLKGYNNHIIPAKHGELASGLIGQGRMAEPDEIVDFIEDEIECNLPLNGKTVLVSAGPTYEYIDPVRFIGNVSSGKMGYEIAKAAANLGAKTILISGPSNERVTGTNVKLEDITSANEMHEKMHENYANADIVIMSAAVADYKPKEKHDQKIKKSSEKMTLELTKTVDILRSLGDKKEKQYLVGFALETNDEIENAKKKLNSKNLDAIVLNSLNDKGAGFKLDTNKITILSKEGNIEEFKLKNKSEVAKDILNFILTKIN